MTCRVCKVFALAHWLMKVIPRRMHCESVYPMRSLASKVVTIGMAVGVTVGMAHRRYDR